MTLRSPKTGATARRRAAAASRGHQLIRSSASRSNRRPPNSQPEATPSAMALASMCVAWRRLLSEALSELGERLVLDGWQIADLERPRAALLKELVDRPDH